MRGFTSGAMVALGIASAAAFYICNHFMALFMIGGGIGGDGLDIATAYFLDPRYLSVLSTDSTALGVSILAIVLIWSAYAYSVSRGTFRRGEEHGSAEWASNKEMAEYGDMDEPVDNVILSKTVRLRYSRSTDYEHQRNRNVMVIGGSGSGKTRGYVKPNLMQIPAIENMPAGDKKAGKDKALAKQDRFARSYFVTDPKGMTRVETGHLFAENGYTIREFNTIDWAASMHYNPLAYVQSEDDVITFATCLIKNTTPPDANKGDPFWENSEKLLYEAIINYMITELPPEDRNLPMMCRLLDLGKIDDNNPGMSGLDILFYEVEHGLRFEGEKDPEAFAENASVKSGSKQAESAWSKVRAPRPNHPGVLAYNSFKSGATETLQSIFISCKVRLAPLRAEAVEKVLLDDDMHIDMLGDEKTVVFAIMSDQDSTFNFLHALLIWQTMKQLSDRALLRYADRGGALPIGVDFLLDEFANYYVPDIEKTVAVCRSRNIGLTLILQSRAQLKARYGDSQDIISDNCDSLVFLGGKSEETNKSLSESMGQQTITTDNASRSHGGSSSGGWSDQIAQHGRDLLQASEIGKMSNSECLVLIRGANPYRGPKYDVTEHPMYKYIDPGHKGSVYQRGFDIVAYRVNPHYYRHDAQVKASCEQIVRTMKLNVRKDEPRDTVQVTYRITVENTSEHRAYNLHGFAEFSSVCDSNIQSQADGRGIAFPGVEPFGRKAGFHWDRVSQRSNIASIPSDGAALEDGVNDIIGFDIRRGRYLMDSITVQPKTKIIYTITVEADGDMARSCASNSFGIREGKISEMEPVEMHLNLDIFLSCANADVPEFHASTPAYLHPDGRLEIGDCE